MNRRITGAFLILVPILFNAAFFALGSAFDYPNILRQPTDVILQRFAAGGSGLIAIWYFFAITSVLAIPLAILLYGLFRDEFPHIALAATIIGVLSGLVQVMGLFRWTFLVPSLATHFTDSAASPAARETAAMIFEAAHQYLGVAIGEHLGYLFTGMWTILLSVMMLRSKVFRPWLGWLGIVAAVGILIGMLEPAGFAPAGMINALSYILWSLWMIIAGVFVIRSK